MLDFKVQKLGNCQLLVTLMSLDAKEKSMIFHCAVEEMAAGVVAYTKGALVQDAFPFLNADEREFLLTGLSKEDWEKIFDDC